MTRKTLYLASLLLFLFPLEALSQNILDEYMVQPEVWHFVKPKGVGVGSQGDISLSVPVMTVPGRGIDYDITFNYRSSITYRQRASWVGLGWSFDPGSVTREPGGNAIWSTSTDDGAYGVDEFDSPTPEPALPDNYYISIPGKGTAEVTQVQSYVYDKPELVPSVGAGDFSANTHRPWRVEGFLSGTPINTIDGRSTGMTNGDDKGNDGFTQRNDIERSEVTIPDGTRYLFEAPSLSYFDLLTKYSNDQAAPVRQIYVSTWRLTAILGVGYEDANGDGIPNSGDTGPWVRLKYSSVLSDDASTINEIGGKKEFAQTRFLEEIHTPTHYAVFTSESRLGPHFAEYEDDIQRRLTNITLYSKLDGSLNPLKETVLVQDETSMGPIDDSEVTTKARLRLDELRFFGTGGSSGSNERPGYAFAYDNEADDKSAQDVGTFQGDLDRFGYYSYGFGGGTDDPDGGSTWSMTKVTYPTGGWDRFYYETDEVVAEKIYYTRHHLPTSDSPEDYYDFTGETRQGGARVTKITRYDGRGDSTRTTYAYGDGHASGVPPRWWVQKKQNYSPNVRMYTAAMRGRVGVFYEYVEKQNADGGSVRTYYTERTDPDVNVIGAVFYRRRWTNNNTYDTYCPGEDTNCYSISIIQDNAHWNWGKVEKRAYRDDGGTVVKEEERTLHLYYLGGDLARVWETSSSTSSP